MDENRPYVRDVAGRILGKLRIISSSPSGKAALAKIRNSAGKSMHESSDVWPFIFDEMPEGFLGTGKHESAEEKSILLALQLYAIHQQGKGYDVILDPKEKKWSNVGTAFRSMRIGGDSAAIDRRFNALITSATFEELANHLRQMIKLLKSKTDAKLDYAQLAQDLYWIIVGSESQVRLKWAREYYFNYGLEKGEENE